MTKILLTFNINDNNQDLGQIEEKFEAKSMKELLLKIKKFERNTSKEYRSLDHVRGKVWLSLMRDYKFKGEIIQY